MRAPRVLLAEDDEQTRSVMVRVLKLLGMDVEAAVDGGRALIALTSLYKDGRSPTDIDLIVTDVCMPVVDGLELLKQWRAAGWRTPVIVVTAFPDERVRNTVEVIGGVLLEKPVDIDRLEDAVKTLLPGRAPTP